MHNLILNTDSYKASHFLQYPEGAEFISSYVESRGGEYGESVFFGLQMFIKDYLLTPITATDIEEAAELYAAHGVPFHRAGWEYILNAYDGMLPIEVQAIPEGTKLATKNVLVQVINTDPKCAWLTSYVETALLRAIWYPTTVATVSNACKEVITRYMEKTADSLEGIEFKLHDFGARGASSNETAAIGGLAHLVNFMGTDTIAAILAGRKYYYEPMAGFSIPAAEHSSMTSWGREGEADAYANMLKQFGGKDSLVAVVSDSYDIFHAITEIWGKQLKEQVETHGGRLVVRPDSGEPVQMVSDVVEALMDAFGYIENTKGYKQLPDFVRVIQGDGVSVKAIENILEEMERRKLSAENVAFGMGAELLQKVNRDTLRFAMKASAIRINGEWRDVYKDPVTDKGKRSKRGRLALVNVDGEYQTIREDELAGQTNLLETVFKNGKLLKEVNFAKVREVARQ